MTDTSAYATTFQLVDRNKDGRISAEELKALMTALGETVTDERAAQVVEQMDGDSDGEISLEEFATFMSRTP